MNQRHIAAVDGVTWNLLIGAYAHIGIIRSTQSITQRIPQHFHNNIQIQNSLIDM